MVRAPESFLDNIMRRSNHASLFVDQDIPIRSYLCLHLRANISWFVYIFGFPIYTSKFHNVLFQQENWTFLLGLTELYIVLYTCKLILDICGICGWSIYVILNSTKPVRIHIRHKRELDLCIFERNCIHSWST